MTQVQLPPHPLTNKHIIVAGAGISGLAFAISLHKLWPSVSSSAPPRITLYERDPEAVPSNRQGYSLSLRSDAPTAGIQTLQKMGLLDQLIERSVGTSGAEGTKQEGGFCMWRVVNGGGAKGGEGEKKWQRVLKIASKTPPGCPVSAIRIARAELRRALVDAVEALPNVTINWGTSITGVSPSSTNPTEVSITLATGATDIASLLLAADGSSSKLRALLRPGDTLHFAGPTCIYALCPIANLHPSGLPSEFGTVISGAGTALFLAPVDAEKMVWCLSWHVDSPPVPKRAPLSAADSAALLDEARRHGLPVFGARFERILKNTDMQSLTQFNALDKPAFAHTAGYIASQSQPQSQPQSQSPDLGSLEPRVIFLGDANHAVSPFAGNGANLALMDGWGVAESLLYTPAPTREDGKAKGKVEEEAFEEYLWEVVRRYDKEAVGRAKKVVSMSHFSIRVMHSKGWWSSFWFLVLGVVRWLFFRKVD